MSTAPPMIPPDDPKRNLTLARPDNLSHIGLVGDTYTITVTGEDTNGRFCVIDMVRHAKIQTTLDLYTQEDSDETRAAQGEFLNAVGMSAAVN
jgi:hypothetical protein